ncbi:MAG TPA: hypothetical protein VI942_11610, partial [Thermoanaerobaculia bacterium]|nr:hypothetical protein [Thermoanaerobaculia bacterium]
MSPIDDPDSPKARRLTRLAARMKTENKEPGATVRRRAGRVEPVADRPERPLLQAADALDADWDELPKREKHGRRGAAARKRAPAAPLVARALEPAAGD